MGGVDVQCALPGSDKDNFGGQPDLATSAAAPARPLRQLTAASDRGGFSLAVTDRGYTMLIGGIGREIDEIFPLRPGVLLPLVSTNLAKLLRSHGALTL
ncbi:hypothetical protein OIE68_17680 [Nocardia vinacea]|uniref:hypothetical protein n=1 Tax=Nocardia vinacea TaxID=96468 RepID=UPI002E15A689|nr:hypothetical protein OIE68_17680 [Nocardia vinacea]